MAKEIETTVNELLVWAEEGNRIPVPIESVSGQATIEELAQVVNILANRQRQLAALTLPQPITGDDEDGEIPPHGLSNQPVPVDDGLDEPQVLALENAEFGYPTTAFTSGATITLDPCNQDGTDLASGSTDHVKVHLHTDGETSVEVPFATSQILTFVRYEEPSSSGVDGMLIGMVGGTYASPKDATYSGEHSEAKRVAGTTNWDRSSQGSNDGYKESVVVGEAYYEAGTKTWNEYRVDKTYDSLGRLALVGEEYLQEIVQTVDCPNDADGGSY